MRFSAPRSTVKNESAHYCQQLGSLCWLNEMVTTDLTYHPTEGLHKYEEVYLQAPGGHFEQVLYKQIHCSAHYFTEYTSNGSSSVSDKRQNLCQRYSSSN